MLIGVTLWLTGTWYSGSTRSFMAYIDGLSLIITCLITLAAIGPTGHCNDNDKTEIFTTSVRVVIAVCLITWILFIEGGIKRIFVDIPHRFYLSFIKSRSETLIPQYRHIEFDTSRIIYNMLDFWALVLVLDGAYYGLGGYTSLVKVMIILSLWLRSYSVIRMVFDVRKVLCDVLKSGGGKVTTGIEKASTFTYLSTTINVFLLIAMVIGASLNNSSDMLFINIMAFLIHITLWFIIASNLSIFNDTELTLFNLMLAKHPSSTYSDAYLSKLRLIDFFKLILLALSFIVWGSLGEFSTGTFQYVGRTARYLGKVMPLLYVVFSRLWSFWTQRNIYWKDITNNRRSSLSLFTVVPELPPVLSEASTPFSKEFVLTLTFLTMLASGTV